MEQERFSRLQMIALVVLRVVIGWHFLYEGVAKLLKPNWSAAGFLLQSRGPFADVFQWMAARPEVLACGQSHEHVGAGVHRSGA